MANGNLFPLAWRENEGCNPTLWPCLSEQGHSVYPSALLEVESNAEGGHTLGFGLVLVAYTERYAAPVDTDSRIDKETSGRIFFNGDVRTGAQCHEGCHAPLCQRVFAVDEERRQVERIGLEVGLELDTEGGSATDVEAVAEAVAVRGADERLLVGVGFQLNVSAVATTEHTVCCFGILCRH